jgi:hypothetical protein
MNFYRYNLVLTILELTGKSGITHIFLLILEPRIE